MSQRVALYIALTLIIATLLPDCTVSTTPTAQPTLSINVREAGRGY